jgi:hypothetical protein
MPQRSATLTLPRFRFDSPALARLAALAVGIGMAAATAGCERPPSASSLREWTPADHDRAEEETSQPGRPGAPAPGNQGPGNQGNPGPGSPSQGASSPPTAPPPKGSARAAAAGGQETLIEATWEAACSPCHGPTGHGDGPNGPMVNAPDITREDLLSKITDDEIAFQIKNGKNRMPKFDLPEPVVRGLVARIRAMRGR